mgnify:FL=1
MSAAHSPAADACVMRRALDALKAATVVHEPLPEVATNAVIDTARLAHGVALAVRITRSTRSPDTAAQRHRHGTDGRDATGCCIWVPCDAALLSCATAVLGHQRAILVDDILRLSRALPQHFECHRDDVTAGGLWLCFVDPSDDPAIAGLGPVPSDVEWKLALSKATPGAAAAPVSQEPLIERARSAVREPTQSLQRASADGCTAAADRSPPPPIALPADIAAYLSHEKRADLEAHHAAVSHAMTPEAVAQTRAVAAKAELVATYDRLRQLFGAKRTTIGTEEAIAALVPSTPAATNGPATGEPNTAVDSSRRRSAARILRLLACPSSGMSLVNSEEISSAAVRPTTPEEFLRAHAAPGGTADSLSVRTIALDRSRCCRADIAESTTTIATSSPAC